MTKLQLNEEKVGIVYYLYTNNEYNLVKPIAD